MKRFTIKGIRIKNFRGIDKLELKELKDINYILGRNGTNKSSIIFAIRFLLDAKFRRSQINKIVREDFYKNNIDDPIVFEMFIDFSKNWIL